MGTDTDKGRPKYSEENSSKCNFIRKNTIITVQAVGNRVSGIDGGRNTSQYYCVLKYNNS